MPYPQLPPGLVSGIAGNLRSLLTLPVLTGLSSAVGTRADRSRAQACAMLAAGQRQLRRILSQVPSLRLPVKLPPRPPAGRSPEKRPEGLEEGFIRAFLEFWIGLILLLVSRYSLSLPHLPGRGGARRGPPAPYLTPQLLLSPLLCFSLRSV